MLRVAVTAVFAFQARERTGDSAREISSWNLARESERMESLARLAFGEFNQGTLTSNANDKVIFVRLAQEPDLRINALGNAPPGGRERGERIANMASVERDGL